MVVLHIDVCNVLAVPAEGDSPITGHTDRIAVPLFSPQAILPLPEFVRRYYIASSTHGGGAGGSDSSLPGVGLSANQPTCPGNNFGAGVLPANPMPHLQTVNALRAHFRNWVVKGVPPPPSRFPTLAPRPGETSATLAAANKEAIGMPALPGLRPTVPEADFIMPVFDYDWGPQFNAVDGSGIAANAPPPIRRILPMFAPKVDADGNELGGVPVVLRDAPLGTYLGWNITADGFHKGQICNYVGGMVPFARTAEERRARNDPRPSLEFARRLCRGRDPRGGAGRRRRLPARGRRRCADCRGSRERRAEVAAHYWPVASFHTGPIWRSLTPSRRRLYGISTGSVASSPGWSATLARATRPKVGTMAPGVGIGRERERARETIPASSLTGCPALVT